MPLTQVSSRLIEDTLRYVLGASGTDHYTFTGKGLTGAVNDPTLTLSRGHTYIFENRSGGHPFYIKTSIANGGTNDAYNTGVTNNGGGNGTEIVFTVPHDAPDTLYYQCSSHSSMAGQLSISGSVADGSITESKLADDAVTADKLANSINTAIAANTAKDLTALSASNLTSGTVPDARFPATLPAISGANLTNLPPNRVNRNLIINGAMQVAQRGTSSTTNGYGNVDRFYAYANNTGVTTTFAQVDIASGNAYDAGFRKALKISLSGAGTANSNGEIEIFQKIEAQDIANSGWNYKSSSSKITLSFWVKSSTAQTFPVHLRTEGGSSYGYGFTYTVTQPNVWQKISHSIAGNSNLAINNDNATGFRVYAGMPFQGSGFDGGSSDTWVTYSGSTRVPPVPDTWLTAGASTFEITGVQLEVGSVATDFEHLSYADDLRRCQRYFQQYITYAEYTLGATGNMGLPIVTLATPMRASPTFTSTSEAKSSNWTFSSFSMLNPPNSSTLGYSYFQLLINTSDSNYGYIRKIGTASAEL